MGSESETRSDSRPRKRLQAVIPKVAAAAARLLAAEEVEEPHRPVVAEEEVKRKKPRRERQERRLRLAHRVQLAAGRSRPGTWRRSCCGLVSGRGFPETVHEDNGCARRRTWHSRRRQHTGPGHRSTERTGQRNPPTRSGSDCSRRAAQDCS